MKKTKTSEAKAGTKKAASPKIEKPAAKSWRPKETQRCAKVSILSHTISKKDNLLLGVDDAAERALMFTHIVVNLLVLYYERKLREWLGSNAPADTPAGAARRRIEQVVSAGENNKKVKEQKAKAKKKVAEEPSSTEDDEADEVLDLSARAGQAARGLYNPVTDLESDGDGAYAARLSGTAKEARRLIFAELRVDPSIIERSDVRAAISPGETNVRPPAWARLADAEHVTKTTKRWRAAGLDHTHSGLRAVAVTDEDMVRRFKKSKDPQAAFEKWLSAKVEKSISVHSGCDPMRELLYGSGWLAQNRMLKPHELLGCEDLDGMSELGYLSFAAAMVCVAQDWTNNANRKKDRLKQAEQRASFDDMKKTPQWAAMMRYEESRREECSRESGHRVDSYKIDGHELKGYSKIRKLWIDRLLKSPPASPVDLTEIRIRYFTENPELQGDHRLFEFLETEENWCLWDGRAAAVTDDRYARDHDWVGAVSRFNRIDRPLSGIGFTYHHPFLHPFFFSFKGGGKSTTGGLRMSLSSSAFFEAAQSRKASFTLLSGGPTTNAKGESQPWSDLGVKSFEFPISSSRQLMPFVTRSINGRVERLFPGISDEPRLNDDQTIALGPDGRWDRTISADLEPVLSALGDGKIDHARELLAEIGARAKARALRQDVSRLERFMETGWWMNGRKASIGGAKLVIARGALKAAWSGLSGADRARINSPFSTKSGNSKLGSRLDMSARIDRDYVDRMLKALLERRAYFERRADRRRKLGKELGKAIQPGRHMKRDHETRAKLPVSLMISMNMQCAQKRFSTSKENVSFGRKHVVTGALPMAATPELLRSIEQDVLAGRPFRLLAIDMRVRLAGGYAVLRLGRPGTGGGKPEINVPGTSLTAVVERTGLMKLGGEGVISTALESLEIATKHAHVVIGRQNEAAHWLNKVASGKAVAEFASGDVDTNRMFRLADDMAASIEAEFAVRTAGGTVESLPPVPVVKGNGDLYLSGGEFVSAFRTVFDLHERYVVFPAMDRLSEEFDHEGRSDVDSTKARRLSDFSGGISIRRIGALEDAWTANKRFAARAIMVRHETANMPTRVADGLTWNRRIGPGFFCGLKRHIEKMKDDRLRKDVAMILETAHGGRLAPDMTRPFPRVDAVVIEDLGRYRFKSDRPRSENRRLAKWRHRRLAELLSMACDMHGFVLCGSTAGYTSRFSALDGSPGVSCGFLHLSQVTSPFWEAKCLRDERLREAEVGRLIVDNDDGFFFVPVTGDEVKLIHSPRNAAVNIGMRFLVKPLPSVLWLQRAEGSNWVCVSRGPVEGRIFHGLNDGKEHFIDTGMTAAIEQKAVAEPAATAATSDNTPTAGSSARAKIKVFRDPSGTMFNGGWTSAEVFEAAVADRVWSKLEKSELKSQGVTRVPAYATD